ncbi:MULTISPECIES: TioE family transcriptional regulator [unclassified Streptomyces]|uniref:TioE family transcriptional regulator n=1 Tax=unclassified Streptomyces TaxID=2593676 RepID=UPI001B367CAE|nr:MULTISPECIES: TioE family transcriptional regulator [unclassified Streptomyces]MBQ0862793.1 TioE family transcriptional regulator [Streptomyces sp. RK75]MBQ1124112.1 TioE family transcriptional regulator [Streptomyces sp. B15]
MGEKLQNGGRLRPIDLARGHGLSTQAVRNYEAAGVLPAADRTPHGYRAYTSLHAGALQAFLALLPGHGHRTATSIMRAVNEGAVDEAFRLIDESHAQLLDDRGTLQSVESALRDLEPGAAPESDAAHESGAASGSAAGSRTGGSMFIGPLAGKLGIRPATLRKWERAGVVRPRRDPLTGYRVYDEADVRDARLAHQLRRGGRPLGQIAPLLAQVRAAGGLEPLEAALCDWRGRLSARGRAMLNGAAELETYLRERG